MSVSAASAGAAKPSAAVVASASASFFIAVLLYGTAELQPKINALAALRAAAVAAEEARAEAEEAAHALTRPEPVSVFISRKTQRLYVRRAFEPIFDIPITIRDTDLPIGTHVFTALQRSGPKGDMQWSVVSFVGSNVGMTDTQGTGTGYRALDLVVNEADRQNAKAALDRVVIPDDTVDRITQLVSPRFSLIISDEGPSSETGHGTEFVIIMSDEPQGGLAHRRRELDIGVGYEFSSRPDPLACSVRNGPPARVMMMSLFGPKLTCQSR